MDMLLLTALSYQTILQILTPASCALFFGGATLLFLRTNGNRARRILAWVVVLWGTGFLMQLISRLAGSQVFVHRDFFSPVSLTIGNFYALILLPYVVEVVRPGWLNGKRLGMLALPYICLYMSYFIVLSILHEPIIKLSGIEDLTVHIGQFNVWFRFIIFASVFIYLALLQWLIFHYQHKYKHWCRENYASSRQMDINWLHYFEMGMYLMTFIYGLLLFVGTPITFVFHQIVIATFFTYVIYKGLFHENPYPEGFFHASMQTSEEMIPPVDTDNSFTLHLPDYQRTITTWMQTTKPYLRADFKLMDASEVLPLNRSYLSRVFNEGLGASFSQIALNYRLEEAKKQLTEESDSRINEIALRCGFASHSSFHRAFVKQIGITPKEYRLKAWQ